MAAFRQSRADAGSAACAARRGRHRRVRTKKSWIAARSSIVQAPRQPENLGVESAQQKGDSPMELVPPSPLGPYAALDRLGDEIAELSAHLDAATAPLLDLIREFDARGGWDTGFRSFAAPPPPRARAGPSYGPARPLARVATREPQERFLAAGQAGTAAHVERIVRGWRRMD